VIFFNDAKVSIFFLVVQRADMLCTLQAMSI